MDYGIGPFAGESLGASTYQTFYNLAAEWSPSILDQTNHFIMNGVYELPFWRQSARPVTKVLGGWQVGGIWSALSGGPIGVNAAVNNTFSQGGGQRPNWNGQNACVANPTPARWLDAGVFSNPAPYAFGTAPRTFNGCRTAGTLQVDLTLTKNTRFLERWNLQFRRRFSISRTRGGLLRLMRASGIRGSDR
jgi:hypothetical protein